jgi:hypothetical protein
MKTSFVFRRAIQALLPATLLLAACGKSDTPAPAVTPDTAKVLAVHGAVNNSTRPIKVTVGDKEGPSVAYGTNTPYQTIATGNLAVKATIDASGGATLYNMPQTVAKDKSYSFFAYSVPGQSTATVSGLWVEDVLTAPAVATNAKVRLVHIGQDLDSPLTLSKTPSGGGALVAVTTATAAGQASAFVEIPAGTASYNLANSSNSAIQPAFGGAVLATPFVAGGIYTIIVRGASAATAPTDNEKFTLQLIKNN